MTPEDLIAEHEAHAEERRRIEGLAKAAYFGISVEDFLASPIGQYLTARAAVEREEHLEALVTAPAHDSATVIALQNHIKVIDQWQRWLGEAINTGRSAAKVLDAEDA